MMYLLLVIGLVLLVIGGDTLVRGSVAVAKRMGVSPLMIGLTLVGFGTSAPELVTSINAALADVPGLAIGNVVGSNIANILLILGASAVIMPVLCSPKALMRDGAVTMGATVIAVLVFLFLGEVGRIMGAGFVLILLAYLAWTYITEKNNPQEESTKMHEHEVVLAEPVPDPGNLWLSLGLAVGGIIMTVGGAKLLVDNSVLMARELGVSETVIGLTIVAIGTSLPELVTAVMASIRREQDIIVGNILGSNIFNILSILGITALIKPIPVPQEIINLDMWIMLGVTALLGVFAWTGNRISRGEGAIFLILYAAYLIFLSQNSGLV